jgi:membrane associated rhomboid family serine protease
VSLPPPTIPRCYRHPDREGGRSCTRCGKPACSDCLVQASVGSHCLDCAKASRPDVNTRVKLASSRVLTPVTYGLIAANVGLFVLMGLADPAAWRGRITPLHGQLGLSRSLLEFGAINVDGTPMDPHGWYRLVSSGFIHFGFIHVAMNMLLLYQLGMLLERTLGPTRTAAVYFSSLLAGSFGVVLMASDGLTGGASGAVFGLMACAAVGMHRRGVNIFSTGIGTTLLLNLVLTFTVSGISIGGHLGGAIGGAICGWFLLAPGWKPTPKWVGWAVCAAIAVVSVGGAVALSI